jgi:putative transcriptional regulator
MADQGEDIGSIIGKRVRSLREEHGWTQGELADRAQRDRTHISALEAGKHHNPTISLIFDLARALKTTPQYVLGLDNYSGIIVDDLTDLPPALQEVVQIAGGLSAGRQSELRYIVRALAAAENAEIGSLVADLETQKELLRQLHRAGGDALLARFFELAGFPHSMAEDVDGLRVRLGF